MFGFVGAVRRNVENIKKRSRVADESMVDEVGNRDEVERRRRQGHNGTIMSVILYSIIHAPISILSCVSTPNASDGVWVSGADHFSHISEINHLMVSDSMRYAILM